MTEPTGVYEQPEAESVGRYEQAETLARAFEPAAPEPGAVETEGASASEDAKGIGEPPAAEPETSAEVAGDQPEPLAELTAAMTRLASEVGKHHERATHREAVIDKLHAEAERLRVGERRGAVRPLLTVFARLREELKRQSAVLPEQFDRDRAQKLLLSFADTIEITLEEYGVAIEVPKHGDDFSVRRHKVVASKPTDDPDLVRRIAGVRRDGYRDVEADALIAQAEVTVYVAAPNPEVAQADPVAAERIPEPVTAELPVTMRPGQGSGEGNDKRAEVAHAPGDETN